MADISLFDLTGKKALVTGGAMGIGRGCAIALARAGADVAIVDLNEEAGAKTAEEIRAMGVEAFFVACDVTKKAEVQAMVRQVVEHPGVVHMTKTLAAEWGRFNINVNCISPSYVLTPMHASTPVVVRERIRELTPLGHVERPEDLHGAVIFLASAASDYVTGLDLMVDGGHTLNAWLTPLSRSVPPRVDAEEETVQMKHDLDLLGMLTREVGREMVVVGGGSRSPLWRQILADALQVDIVKTNVGQEAGALGAAAVAAVAVGLWDDFSQVDEAHQVESVTRPVAENANIYDQLLPIFRQSSLDQARLGDALAAVTL